ncbi:MAG: hypothetical protein D6731_21800 [Planctomycetota bacterium]|nr:MAG: hypothetical protein D6731_21800 [Planctomycetota bacterium]
MRQAALLWIHDRGRAATERLGEAVYGGLLERGPYGEVRCLRGPAAGGEVLAAAARDLAARSEALDVFCSAHTTRRAPAAWREALAPARDALRLVYSTACWGARAELQAWAAAGARAVVCHEGLNDPLVAMPLVLSRWLTGSPLGDAVVEGYRETQALHALAKALAWTRRLVAPREVPDGYGVGDPLQGSRPVVWGEASLRLGGAEEDPALRYDPATGGALGLAVRAAVGRFAFDRGDLAELLAERGLPEPWADLAEAFRRAEAVSRVGAQRAPGLVVSFARPLVCRLPAGPQLRLSERVALAPGPLDLERGRLDFEVQGAALGSGLTACRLHRLGVRSGRRGLFLRVAGVACGFLPVRLSVPLPSVPLRVALPEERARLSAGVRFLEGDAAAL